MPPPTPPQDQPKRRPRRRPAWALGLALALALGLVLAWAFWNGLRPVLDGLATHNPAASALMELRAQASGRRPQQAWVGLGAISPHLLQAVLIAEDDRFFRHSGFDLVMLRKAIERNLAAGEVRYGASTLTQQLAKNLYLSPEKSLLRKVQEACITLGLELYLDKRRILELYLNLVEWGPGVFGAQAAARHHFGVRAAELTPHQAARLAAVLPNPRRFSASRPSPYIRKRTQEILKEMHRRGPGVIWR